MKIRAAKYGFGRKGLEVNNETMYCLCSRDYKDPKMVIINEQVHNTIQSGHYTDNKNRGGEFFN